jgi:hypothetical protein
MKQLRIATVCLRCACAPKIAVSTPSPSDEPNASASPSPVPTTPPAKPTDDSIAARKPLDLPLDETTGKPADPDAFDGPNPYEPFLRR